MAVDMHEPVESVRVSGSVSREGMCVEKAAERRFAFGFRLEPLAHVGARPLRGIVRGRTLAMQVDGAIARVPHVAMPLEPT